MFSALDIAKWFILKTNAEVELNEIDNDFDVYERITHLKLQKILYYAYGIFLSYTEGKKLFEEKILAWEHGPVIDEVYQEYKSYKRNPIEYDLKEEDENIISDISNCQEVVKVLNMTYENYAGYTAWQLRNMTHEVGTPWDITTEEEGFNVEIKDELIKGYFDTEVMED
ncbi:MAG TPA: hypothetical protein DCP90_05850 [Clostridiales bacterium]|nr:hypothetical protein [Clostridiales bacterium]